MKGAKAMTIDKVREEIAKVNKLLHDLLDSEPCDLDHSARI